MRPMRSKRPKARSGDVTITVAAERTGLTPRALRYYEDIRLIRPQRSGMTRIYTGATLRYVELIGALRAAGVDLRTIAEALAPDCPETKQAAIKAALDARLDQLAMERSRIRGILASLDFLEPSSAYDLRTSAS